MNTLIPIFMFSYVIPIENLRSLNTRDCMGIQKYIWRKSITDNIAILF